MVPAGKSVAFKVQNVQAQAHIAVIDPFLDTELADHEGHRRSMPGVAESTPKRRNVITISERDGRSRAGESTGNSCMINVIEKPAPTCLTETESITNSVPELFHWP